MINYEDVKGEIREVAAKFNCIGDATWMRQEAKKEKYQVKGYQHMLKRSTICEGVTPKDVYKSVYMCKKDLYVNFKYYMAYIEEYESCWDLFIMPISPISFDKAKHIKLDAVPSVGQLKEVINSWF